MSSPDNSPPNAPPNSTATRPKAQGEAWRGGDPGLIAAQFCTPLALVGIFLPPRKIDMRFFLFAGTALWGTNRLTAEYSGSGVSLAERMGNRLQSFNPNELSDKAKETQRLIKEEKARRLLLRQQQQQQQGQMVRKEGEEEKAKAKATGEGGEGEGGEKGILEKVWMGNSPEDWKAKQERREKEALKEGGEGYWGLITWQIGEAVNELPWVAKKNKEKGEEGEKKNDGK